MNDSKETKQTSSRNVANANNVEVFTDLLKIVNHGYSLTWCKSIFAYLGPTAKETMELRNYCKLFSKALKPPCWTTFPHPSYPSLKRFIHCLNEMSASDLMNIPKVLLIENGVYDVGHEVVDINIPISIIGESREHCIVMGGLKLKGKKKDDINVSNLTLRESNGYGVCGYNGASIHLDNVSVENSGGCGVHVVVWGTKRSTMKNCNISQSKYSGLRVGDGGFMTISGNATTIHHNCTNEIRYGYGLHRLDLSSSILLVSPLTKEMISTNNDWAEITVV